MSLLKTLHQIVSPRAMADEILRLQLEACIVARSIYPGTPPHIWLAHAWLSRTAAWYGPVVALGQGTQEAALDLTFGFSLLEWPSSARALGHYVIETEQPTIPKLLPEYEREAVELAAMIEGFKRSGYALRRYHEMNPGMRAERVGNGRLVFMPDIEDAVVEEPPPTPPPPPPPPLPPPIARPNVEPPASYMTLCRVCRSEATGRTSAFGTQIVWCRRCNREYDY